MDDTIRYMRAALKEAEKAKQKNEVPIGAVIVKDNRIIARGHNTREKTNQVIDHAEMRAIRKANKKLNSWRLDGCDIYVTLEPCPMCAGAMIQSRIRAIYFGAFDPKAGACGSVINLFKDATWNHKNLVIPGVLENECSKKISDFFRELREKK